MRFSVSTLTDCDGFMIRAEWSNRQTDVILRTISIKIHRLFHTTTIGWPCCTSYDYVQQGLRKPLVWNLKQEKSDAHGITVIIVIDGNSVSVTPVCLWWIHKQPLTVPCRECESYNRVLIRLLLAVVRMNVANLRSGLCWSSKLCLYRRKKMGVAQRWTCFERTSAEFWCRVKSVRISSIGFEQDHDVSW